MKIWHIFNPEHDMALAAGIKGFTPPAAGRGMRYWLGFLPSFWADDGDVVIVDNVEVAHTCGAPFQQWLPDVTYVTLDTSQCLAEDIPPSKIDVWGWDAAVRWQLLKAGVMKDKDLPDDTMVSAIRHLSHREASIPILKALVEANDFTIGERICLRSLDEVRNYIEQNHRIVVKAPWSCSGRGVRYFQNSLNDKETGFVGNIIRQQGAIIAEPWYDKVLDLALEFTADGRGGVMYEGLSLFDTSKGAYTGNLLVPEEQKLHLLATYIKPEKIFVVREQLLSILANEIVHNYIGPLGVDMMVVRTDSDFFLNPCVEINLRRTMGHVALSVARCTKFQFRTMRMVPGRQYYLQLD